jgi:hypothetical protein
VPFGVFEVRDGRVVPLDSRMQMFDYASVEGVRGGTSQPAARTWSLTRNPRMQRNLRGKVPR